jgi:hypothetical protein
MSPPRYAADLRRGPARSGGAGFPTAKSGAPRPRWTLIPGTSSPTGSRPIPARRSIARSWNATRTRSSKGRAGRLRGRGYTAYVAVRENQTTVQRRLSAALRAAEEAGYRARTLSAPASTSTSRSWACPAARRRRGDTSLRAMRTSVRSQTSARPTQHARACGAGRRS